jgi:hypothetical protein
MYRLITLFTLYLILLFLSHPESAKSQFSYDNRPLIDILNDIQDRTEYRFLYRESLLAELKLSFTATSSDVIEHLKNEMGNHRLRLVQDRTGVQFIITPFRTSDFEKPDLYIIKGQIVDHITGDRLPYGTVTWVENDQLKGVPVSASGTFSIQTESNLNQVVLTASYLGYESSSVSIPLEDETVLTDVTFRLQPELFTGSEIIVYGTNFFSSVDSLSSSLVRTDRFSPLGDGNAVRALQILPSVQPAMAMNDGLSIRGSAPDGFLLELDGITIFNQSHLFGLIDSFNDDAVINSGFYYGVAPAYVNVPVGGKLSLTTKNGSLNNIQSNVSFSNSTVRSTIQTPIQKGKSSWLLSGRISTMNQLDWLNNDKLIQWGLDVNRPNSASGTDQLVNTSMVTPKESSVRFFDVHNKFYHEGSDGSRTIISSYFGGDRTFQNADRITRTRSLRDRFDEMEVQTENRWNNFTTSVQHQRELSESIYSHSLAGISAYETYFQKDDFIFTENIRTPNTNQTIVFTSPLENRSTMNLFRVNQKFDIDLHPLFIKTGIMGSYYRSEYLENSFDRPQFFSRTASMSTDIFGHLDWRINSLIDLSSGARIQYFSNGRFFNISPRIQTVLFPGQLFSFHAGYSQNVQYINRISFSNAVTADIWILANEDQPPTRSEQITAAITFDPANWLFFQTEIYHKSFDNLRLHELNTPTLINASDITPWFHQNTGTARGLEVLSRFNFSIFDITQTYTLSSAELQNALLNNGEHFFAPWDRTHSSSTLLELNFHQKLSLFASYTIASGTVLFSADQDQNQQTSRLPSYKRLDLTLMYDEQVGTSKVSTKISVFNLMNRKNTWYREVQPVIDFHQTVPAIRALLVDVYDLGIQPSFEVKIHF